MDKFSAQKQTFYYTLKNKGRIITTIAFFLLVNTSYYWEEKLGLFAFPFFLLLAAVYFGLVIVLLRQFYVLFKEKLKQKKQAINFAFTICFYYRRFVKGPTLQPHSIIRSFLL